MAMERRRVMAKACLRLSLLLWNLTMRKKLNLRLSKQLLTTAPARAGSHHPLRRAKRVHHPICNIYPLITFHFLWKTLLENREHFHTIKCTQRGVKRYITKNTQMMRIETPMLQIGKVQHYPWLVKFTTRLLRKISKTNNIGSSQFVGGWPWTEC